MRWSQATEIGKVRLTNEDCRMICPDLGLFAVADGMGGHQAGETASNLALRELERFLRSCLNHYPDAGILLAQGVQEANRLVHRMSLNYPNFKGMGTTLSCVLIRGKILHLAHVGDSRIYLFRQGGVAQLTEDHSLVQQLLKNGGINGEEARHHPYRHILTRALGVGAAVEVDTARLLLQPQDRLLLCTDGLSGLLTDQDLIGIIYRNAELEQSTRLLVELALERGGHDNITVILVAVD